MSQKSKKILFSLALFLLGAGLLFFLLARVGFGNVVQTLILFGVWPFIIFVAISLINFTFYVLRWRIILGLSQPSRFPISFWRLYLHRMSGYAFMYLLPMSVFGSEPIRVGLLHADGVPLKRATSSVVIDLAFEFTAFVIFIALGLALALFERVDLGGSGLLIIAALGLFIALIISFYWATVTGRGFFRLLFRFFRLHERKGFHRLDRWLGGMEAQMTDFFNGHPLALSGLLSLSILSVSFKAFENWFIALNLGAALTLSQALLTSTIPGLAFLIPVPGGLGFFEAGSTGLFALLGIPISAVVLVLIIRLRDIIFITIGVVHASSRLTGWIRHLIIR